MRKPKISDEEILKMMQLEDRNRRKWWQFPFRVINTSRGGPNMPKFQRCPLCNAWAKRREKTVGGARYSCRCGNKWLVLNPYFVGR